MSFNFQVTSHLHIDVQCSTGQVSAPIVFAGQSPDWLVRVVLGAVNTPELRRCDSVAVEGNNTITAEEILTSGMRRSSKILYMYTAAENISGIAPRLLGELCRIPTLCLWMQGRTLCHVSIAVTTNYEIMGYELGWVLSWLISPHC